MKIRFIEPQNVYYEGVSEKLTGHMHFNVGFDLECEIVDYDMENAVLEYSQKILVTHKKTRKVQVTVVVSLDSFERIDG
jgi:hypothetical protein